MWLVHANIIAKKFFKCIEHRRVCIANLLLKTYYDQVPSKIKDLQFQLSTLLQFPMKYEKQFKEQQERVAEVQALEAQRRELDRKIQRLRC